MEPLGRGFANFWASAWRRSANSAPLLPCSAVGRRTWGRGHSGRIGSRRRPRSHGPESPGDATRGSWAPAWRETRRVCRPSVRPGTGPTHRSGSERSFTVPLRAPRSALLFPPPPQRRRHRAPPRPGRLRHPELPTGRTAGPAHSPGVPRARPAARSAAALVSPAPAPRLRTHPLPPQRASRAPPRGAHGPVRPASLQPLQTPATRGLQE